MVCSQAVLRLTMNIERKILTVCLIIAVVMLVLTALGKAQVQKHTPASKPQGHISAELLRRKTQRYSCHCRRHAKVQTATTEKKVNES